MTSQGMEHVYVQQWLVYKLSQDPFLLTQEDLVNDTDDGPRVRVTEAPELARELPSIVFRAGEDQETVIASGARRTEVRIPFGIEVQMPGLDIEPLMPPANRIDAVLSDKALKNITWTAWDGATLTISYVVRDRGYSGTVFINDEDPVRVIGGDWTFCVQVQLPAGYFDV